MANVPEHDQPSSPTNATPAPPASDTTSASEASRRAFLTGMGAAGLGGLMACINLPAYGSESAANQRVRIDAIDDVQTLRNDTLPIPGGKEHFLDQQTTGVNGVIMVSRAHVTRTDTEVAYSIHMDIAVQTFAPGKSTKETPNWSTLANISINGIKGEVEGNIRRDHMTITIIHQDGTSSRVSQEVPVRLDLSQYDEMAPDQLMRAIGQSRLSGGGLPF